MRRCAFCRESLDGRRPQAIYCSNPCRAAASNRRKAADGFAEAQATATPDQAANPHRNRTDGLIRADEYRPATTAEEARALRLMRDHADLWNDAA
jgi:hypothetical protein